ncbi:MAG: lipopolysaccharide kinase InaA family protein [Sulfurimonas sp.]
MLKYKIESCEEFISFTKNIKNMFENSDMLVHDARNQIKVLKTDDVEVVVKAYKIPSLFNKIVYTFFRKPKAYRAYHNAMKLCEMGINTAKAYSYICFYKYFLLDKSYFISQKVDYDLTMKQVFDNDHIENHDDILISFGEFAKTLHDKHIEHKDFSPGNILVKKNQTSYIFTIIDINRMNFQMMNFEQKMQNLCKLWTSEKNLKLIAYGYCIDNQFDEKTVYESISFNNRRDKEKKYMKKKFKILLGLYKEA